MARKNEDPCSVLNALRRITNNQLLVPAMQRDFVWSDDQICDLFDSLLRDYPIGIVLLWRVSNSAAARWPWYACHSELSRESIPQRVNTTASQTTVNAILDGQQRLTALNIGIHGSVVVNLPRSKGPERRYLWINTTVESQKNDSRDPSRRFAFLPLATNEASNWVRVSKVAKCHSRQEVRSLLGTRPARESVDLLDRFRLAMNDPRRIIWQVVENEDLDEVLDIFIRANSKGTQLGYDDMLIAIASSNWRERSPSEEVQSLLENIRKETGFRISKTRIMKAALVLSGAKNVSFRARNLTRENLVGIEKDWECIRKAILTAALILKEIGLQGDSLPAENVIIPVAIYAHRRDLDPTWAKNRRDPKDLDRIRRFVFRSLLKPDFWTGNVDKVLVTCRSVLSPRAKQAHFPLVDLQREIQASTAKSLAFSNDEIAVLMQSRYADKRTAVLLAAIFPEAARRGWNEKDHVWPWDKTKASSGVVGTGGEEPPNLCLLSSDDNKVKGDKTPSRWLESIGKYSEHDRRLRVRDLDLQRAPSSERDLDRFWLNRRAKMEKRLKRTLQSNSA